MKQQAIPFRQKKPGTGPLVDKAEKAPFAPPPPSRTAGAFEQAKPRESSCAIGLSFYPEVAGESGTGIFVDRQGKEGSLDGTEGGLE